MRRGRTLLSARVRRAEALLSPSFPYGALSLLVLVFLAGARDRLIQPDQLIFHFRYQLLNNIPRTGRGCAFRFKRHGLKGRCRDCCGRTFQSMSVPAGRCSVARTQMFPKARQVRRLALVAILSPLAEVESCGDGADAVEAALQALRSGKPYDLICIVIIMPVLNGLDALHIIRQEEEAQGRPRTSRVIITSSSDEAGSTVTRGRGTASVTGRRQSPEACTR